MQQQEKKDLSSYVCEQAVTKTGAHTDKIHTLNMHEHVIVATVNRRKYAENAKFQSSNAKILWDESHLWSLWQKKVESPGEHMSIENLILFSKLVMALTTSIVATKVTRTRACAHGAQHSSVYSTIMSRNLVNNATGWWSEWIMPTKASWQKGYFYYH